MAIRKWNVELSGESHLVELKWSLAECSGEVSVDGKPAKTWGSGGSMPGSIEFNIGLSKAALKRSGGFFENYSLYISNKKCGTPVTEI